MTRVPGRSLALGLILLIGCATSAGHPIAGGSSVGQTRPSAGTSPGPASPIMLPEVDLEANLSDPPARWTHLATVGFGDGPDELGIVMDPAIASIPDVPASFAIGADGTIWVLDVVKKRIAHFTSTGGYLGQVGGFHFDPSHPNPVDLVVSGGTVYVLVAGVGSNTLAGGIVRVGSSGIGPTVPVESGGRSLIVHSLFPTSEGVGGYVWGWADDPGGSGPLGPAELTLPAGSDIRLLPGLPVGSGTWIGPRLDGDDRLELTFTAPAGTSIRPIVFHGVSGTSGPSQTFALTVGVPTPCTAGGALAEFVQVSPTDPGVQRRFGGGRFLLRVGAGPVLWERLPPGDPSLDTDQTRKLATGPDGALYLMVLRSTGVEILRRP
jgi:hypothetical protein